MNDHMTSSPIDKYSTMTDIVYKWLKGAIMSSEFKPGQRLTQDMITKRLQVSRTPVRDAFNRLQSEGLLILKPHVGAIVQNLPIDKIIEIYELRSILEGPAARYACRKITDAGISELVRINQEMIGNQDNPHKFISLNRTFHATLYGFSEREYLVNYIFQLWDITEPYRLMFITASNRTAISIHEHVQIIDALYQNDEKRIEKVIRDHLSEVVQALSNNSANISV